MCTYQHIGRYTALFFGGTAGCCVEQRRLECVDAEVPHSQGGDCGQHTPARRGMTTVIGLRLMVVIIVWMGRVVRLLVLLVVVVGR